MSTTSNTTKVNTNEQESGNECHIETLLRAIGGLAIKRPTSLDSEMQLLSKKIDDAPLMMEVIALRLVKDFIRLLNNIYLIELGKRAWSKLLGFEPLPKVEKTGSAEEYMERYRKYRRDKLSALLRHCQQLHGAVLHDVYQFVNWEASTDYELDESISADDIVKNLRLKLDELNKVKEIYVSDV
jgi:hypothetical protein